MKTKLCIVTILAGIVFGFFSCAKEENISNPAHAALDLPETPYQYSGNDDVGTLGRVLFYDAHLSVNNSISCGSCHKQSLAFSDNVPLSRGFENRLTSRNALPIQNVGGTSDLFWDGREKFLNTMVLKPIVNHVEMGMGDLTAIVNKVKSVSYYNDLFSKAYGSTDIDVTKIAQALSAFTGSIISMNTKFDRSFQNNTVLTGLENQGRLLFFDKYNCNSCHQTKELNGYQIGGGFVNVGLDMEYLDNGVGSLTNNPVDNGKFKIPNLRNVALTAPYMHDGRFKTLGEVMEHYSHGIVNHPNLDIRLRGADGLAAQLNISMQEKDAIIAFMNTLTDFEMITDPRFSNPFKN